MHLNLEDTTYNSNVIGKYFERNTIKIKLPKYGLLLRGNDGVNFNFYETTGNLGYKNLDISLEDILKETWVAPSANLTLISPSHNTLTTTGNLENKFHYKGGDYCEVEDVGLVELVDNIPFYCNIIIFNLNNNVSFTSKDGELFSMIKELDEAINMDETFVRIYKMHKNTFYIFY